MKRALLCTLIAAALLLSACTRASESTVRAPDAGAPLMLCLGACTLPKKAPTPL